MYLSSVDVTGEEPPRDGVGDLKRGKEALDTFKKRVDAILLGLAGSAANHREVAAQRISRDSLSTGSAPFAAADGLFAQYSRVHEQLVTLSRTLGEQIEAMGIAVHGANIGFDNLEEDLRQRFAQIQCGAVRAGSDAQHGTHARHVVREDPAKGVL
ncbi:hypothetical protein [Streptomyces sp. NPDC050504]|uniref:hypothetical protein n=1 Tax=Streptomyces sp. NPDC050504 TaxID=3365618 RepID=UPI0037B363E0